MNAPLRDCPGEDRLLAYLDGESDATSNAALEAHLDGCEPCAERYRKLTRAHERVRRKLELLDEPAPDRDAYDLRPRRAGRRIQFAAAAGVVLAVALTAGPLRGWVIGLLRAPEPEPLVTVVEPAAPEVTEIPVTSSTVSVRFTSVPPSARLEIGRLESERLRFEDPTGRAAVTVGPNELEIRPGEAGSGTTYRLLVPRGVTRLQLLGSAENVTILNLDALPRVIELEGAVAGSDDD